jgi:hypothetical protein
MAGETVRQTLSDVGLTESGRRRCALARPSFAFEENHPTGRDLGFAESGFARPGNPSRDDC